MSTIYSCFIFIVDIIFFIYCTVILEKAKVVIAAAIICKCMLQGASAFNVIIYSHLLSILELFSFRPVEYINVLLCVCWGLTIFFPKVLCKSQVSKVSKQLNYSSNPDSSDLCWHKSLRRHLKTKQT